MEIFSPPRVVPYAQRLGLRATTSLDLLTGCDILTFQGRSMALTALSQQRPRLVILSPPCTMYSALQHMWNLSKMPAAVREEKLKEAKTFLRFAMHIAETQRAAGRWFLFEHPQRASSWADESVVTMAAQCGVEKVTFDQCRFGLCTPASPKCMPKPMRKRTCFLSNAPYCHRLFANKRCVCTSPHHSIQGTFAGVRLSSLSAIYPPKLCLYLALVAAQRDPDPEDEV